MGPREVKLLCARSQGKSVEGMKIELKSSDFCFVDLIIRLWNTSPSLLTTISGQQKPAWHAAATKLNAQFGGGGRLSQFQW